MPRIRWHQASELFSDDPTAHYRAEADLLLEAGVSRETVEAIEWLSWEPVDRDDALLTANVPEALVAFLLEEADVVEGGE